MFTPEEPQSETNATTVMAPADADTMVSPASPEPVSPETQENVSVKQDEQAEEVIAQTQEEMDAINRVHRNEWVQAAASRFGALPWDMHAALKSADLEYATEDEAEKALKKYMKRDIP